MKYNILVVEDEEGIQETVKIFLENQGYSVLQAFNGVQGLQMIEKEHVHLAIVDVMMPMMDGITMVMKLRQRSDIPVIFLSAKSEDIDKITGLNIGGDDYVTKPFEPMELIARVNSNIRRYSQILNLKQNMSDKEDVLLRVGDLSLNPDSKEASIRGVSIHLTAKEYKILKLLMSQPGRIFSSEQIYEHVWEENAVNTETIMVHIRNLRKKIETDPRNPEYIKVVWGIGYKIEKM